jgi:cytochrome P450
MSSDPSSRLSDKDLLDQCSTFLLAGSDSSSVAMTWCLHLLATHPELQTTLLQEIRTAIKESKLHEDFYDSDDSDDSGFAEDPRLKAEGVERSRAAFIDALESLPYLNGVIKETLRLYPPVHCTIRTAMADDEIPLSEPIMTAAGKVTSVKIAKGSYIHIPIEGINTSEELWGPDAAEFK